MSDLVRLRLNWPVGLTQNGRTAYYYSGKLINRAFAQAKGWDFEEVEGQEKTVLSITDLPRVGDDLAAAMISAGFETVKNVANADVEDLVQVDGIGKTTAEKLITAAKDLL